MSIKNVTYNQNRKHEIINQINLYSHLKHTLQWSRTMSHTHSIPPANLHNHSFRLISEIQKQNFTCSSANGWMCCVGRMCIHQAPCLVASVNWMVTNGVNLIFICYIYFLMYYIRIICTLLLVWATIVGVKSHSTYENTVDWSQVIWSSESYSLFLLPSQDGKGRTRC